MTCEFLDYNWWEYDRKDKDEFQSTDVDLSRIKKDVKGDRSDHKLLDLHILSKGIEK